MQRRDVLLAIAARVPATAGGNAVRVAVDGVDGSGKSVFADQLAAVLREQARPVVRASVHDFHHPRVQRSRRGRSSPSGFWLDSFDYDRLRHDVLDPLGPGGSRRYRAAVHDLDTDQHLDLPWVVGPPGVVLVLDGLFLRRDELRDLWTLSVFLDVREAWAIQAAVAPADSSFMTSGRPVGFEVPPTSRKRTMTGLI